MSTTPSGPPSTPSPHTHHPAHAPQGHGTKSSAAQRGRLAALIDYMVYGHRRPGEITIISHSNLFYWWPVWAMGFLMVAITYFQGVHAAFVTGDGTVVKFAGHHDYEFIDKSFLETASQADKDKFPKEDIRAIITETTKEPFPTTWHGGEKKHVWPYMSNSKNPGVIFAITLLVVITITNVPLRGLWSVIILIVILLGSIIFALAGWWNEIFSRGQLLAIHLNMGAYLFISLTLFVIWIVNFAFFDRQRYVSVTAGQVRLRLAVGEGEICYGTTGMVFQKQRSDLFRHWILGGGSGDLILRPAGGKDPIDLPNVLFVGNKVRGIQNLIKEQEVVAG
jgi:hypothetical protein